MRPLIVGHRGAAGQYPENTKVSIEAAASQGAKWIEVDVQPTKDRELVICHDHTIDRCSNGTGRVDQFTLEELKAFDFGAWFAPEFRGEQILTLDELLCVVKARNLRLNLEIKLDTDCAEEVVSEVARLLDIHQIDYETIILSSFCPSVMKVLGKLCPEYNLGVISEKLSCEDIALLKEIKAYSCHLNYENITCGDINLLDELGYRVWCYTVNKPSDFPLLKKVSAIFSDYPERFL